MPLFKDVTYEVRVQREGRWTIDNMHKTEAAARRSANVLLRDNTVEAVRVVKDKLRRDDTHREEIIFDEENPNAGKEIIGISSIEESHFCQDTEDVYGYNSRVTIGKLFRRYLDKELLTPSELLHSHREARRLYNKDNLLSSGVSRAGSLQAKQTDEDPKKRIAALHDLAQKVISRARDAQQSNLPVIGTVGIDKAVRKIRKLKVKEDKNYLIMTAMSQELVDVRDWWGKLGVVLGWLETDAELDPSLISIVDAFVSDILSNAGIIKELLGQQPDLTTALMRLVQLAEGELEIEPLDEKASAGQEEQIEVLSMLNDLFSMKSLPASQQTLVDRIQHELGGRNPLSKDESPEEQEQHFQKILSAVVTEERIVGKAKMAEAILERKTRLLNRGGIKGMREAVGEVVFDLPAPPMATQFLLRLSEGRLAQELMDEITEQLRALILEIDQIHDIIEAELAPLEKMQQITRIFYDVSDSRLPPEARQEIREHLDEMLADYLIKGKVLEKLDNPDWHLRTRAFSMMKLCAARVLPEGRSLTLARDLVVQYLRQPKFEVNLVDDIADPEEKARILRQFHRLLVQAGFK